MTSYTEIPDRKTDRVLSVKEVMDITSLGRTTIYRRVKSGAFPNSVDLGGNRVGWLESDINTWLEQLKQPRAAAG